MIELYTHVADPCEIVLIDDASSEDVGSFIAYWQKMIHKHRVLYTRNKENRGFGYSMCRGARVATGDTLVFLSNDVEVGNDFTKELLEILEQNPNVLVGGELLSHDTGWNNFSGEIVPYLNGWFLACTRSVWELLGGFDPRYGRADFEDVDLCYAAQMNFIELVPLKRSKLRHLGGKSFGYNPEREALTKKNRHLFAEKWNLHE